MNKTNKIIRKTQEESILYEKDLDPRKTEKPISVPKIAHAVFENAHSGYQFYNIPATSLDGKISVLVHSIETDLTEPKGKPFFICTQLEKLLEEIKQVQSQLKNPRSNPNKLFSDVSRLSDSFSYLQWIQKLWLSSDFFSSEDITNIAIQYPAIEGFASDVTGVKSENLEIKKFISDTLNLNPSQFFVRVVEPGLMTGVSGSNVYLVFDKNTQALQCVIKENSDTSTASQEINALHLMNSLENTHSLFPKLLGIGIISKSSGEKQLVYAQTPALGKSLKESIDEFSITQDTERACSLLKLQNLLGIAAESLAKLHQTQPQVLSDDQRNQQKNSHSSIAEKCRQQLLTYLFNLENLQSPIFSHVDFTKLKFIAENTAFSSAGSYVHGDFHPGNIFYEAEKNSCTFIDNDMLVDSIVEKLPAGIASYDIAYFSNWLSVLGSLKKFSKEEVGILQECFQNTYFKAIERSTHLPVNQEELRFMNVFTSIKYIQHLYNCQYQPGHPWNKTLGVENISKLIEILIEQL